MFQIHLCQQCLEIKEQLHRSARKLGFLRTSRWYYRLQVLSIHWCSEDLSSTSAMEYLQRDWFLALVFVLSHNLIIKSLSNRACRDMQIIHFFVSFMLLIWDCSQWRATLSDWACDSIFNLILYIGYNKSLASLFPFTTSRGNLSNILGQFQP